MNDLNEKILSVLGDGRPLRGREIASLLLSKHGINVDRTTVNSTLHKELRNKVVQNNNYQWSIKTQTTEKTSKPVSSDKNPLSRLAMYYLECIAKDMIGISEFARNKYSPNYTQLKSFPGNPGSQQAIDRSLVEKVRRDKNNYVFKVGYPILVREIRRRDGQPDTIVEPLFIFSLDTETVLQGSVVRLLDEDPTPNTKALESITGLNPSDELLLEALELCDQLGLNNEPDEKPGYDELFLRFTQLRGEWPWKEEIDVNKLSVEPLSSINDPGIYNKAAVFVTQKSVYTAGLEKDLQELSKMSGDDYKGSALADWIDSSIAEHEVIDKVLIEPIPLNGEQREAVQRGLSSPLTIVTGPPGTGKSQVVTSLIVNAVYQGQTVLFSSKNNKAVDVVNDRVNELSNRPVMLRLGSRFQTTLSEYLSSLLAARPSQDNESRYREAKSIHEDLLLKISALKKQQEELITLRNKVDQLESLVEQYREEFGPAVFASCQDFEPQVFDDIDQLIEMANAGLRRSDRPHQSFFVRIFWSLINEKRFNETQALFDQCWERLKILSIDKPIVDINDASIELYYHCLTNLSDRCKKARDVNSYFRHLKTLSGKEDLFQISLKEKHLTDEVVANSIGLWTNWLTLMPSRMSQQDRKIIGDYVTVLNLIVAAESNKTNIDRGVWSRYYSFLPKISHILSCWAVTSLSARGRVPLKSGFFDLVIIDEASQCDIASALPLLFRAKRAVIIGDDKQLTHISSISETQDIRLLEKYGLDEGHMAWSYVANSLFRLATTRSTSENIITLRDHHRSHGDIINYSNLRFYGDSLRVATKYEKLKTLPNEPAVRWIDVKGKCIRPESGSTYNDREAEAVVRELTRIVGNGYQGSIGVVTPFRAQYIRILDKVNQNRDLLDRLTIRHFLCDTVHKFQGDERDVMIFSPVISENASEGAVSFLGRTGNLFNVAITRARAGLIVVGDKQLCYNSGIEHYRGFVEYVNRLGDHSPIDAEASFADYGPKYPKSKDSFSVSEWEKYLYQELYKAGIKTIPQHPVGQFYLDLALIDGDRKLNIEVDGEKYHRNWDGELVKRDQLRNKRMIELGWDVKRFWVYEIRDNLKHCIKLVQDWKSSQAKQFD